METTLPKLGYRARSGKKFFKKVLTFFRECDIIITGKENLPNPRGCGDHASQSRNANTLTRSLEQATMGDPASRSSKTVNSSVEQSHHTRPATRVINSRKSLQLGWKAGETRQPNHEKSQWLFFSARRAHVRCARNFYYIILLWVLSSDFLRKITQDLILKFVHYSDL